MSFLHHWEPFQNPNIFNGPFLTLKFDGGFFFSVPQFMTNNYRSCWLLFFVTGTTEPIKVIILCYIMKARYKPVMLFNGADILDYSGSTTAIAPSSRSKHSYTWIIIKIKSISSSVLPINLHLKKGLFERV